MKIVVGFNHFILVTRFEKQKKLFNIYDFHEIMEDCDHDDKTMVSVLQSFGRKIETCYNLSSKRVIVVMQQAKQILSEFFKIF
jgi:hypothetical protein